MRTLFVIALAGLLLSSVRVAADDLPTPKQIFDAWGTAADGFQSVKIVWTEKVHVTAYEGTETKNMNEAIRKRREHAKLPVPVVGPLKDHTHENRYTLWLAKGKWRLEMAGHNFQMSERRAIGVELVNSFDGTVSRTKQLVEGLVTQGFLETNKSPHYVSLGLGWPVIVQLLDRKITKPEGLLAQLKVEGRANVSGKTLIRVSNPKPRINGDESYLLSPEVNYAVAWSETKIEDNVVSRYVANFDPTLPIPSFPKRFITEHFEENKRTISYERFLVSMKVNEPLPADVFTIDFPPGTEVRDSTVKPTKTYTVPGKPADPKSP